jgi:hypothetical protein
VYRPGRLLSTGTRRSTRGSTATNRHRKWRKK